MCVLLQLPREGTTLSLITTHIRLASHRTISWTQPYSITVTFRWPATSIYLIFLIQLQTGPQQTITLLLINLPVIVLISCSVYKMLNHCENGHPNFQSPKPKDSSFTAIDDKDTRQVLTFPIVAALQSDIHCCMYVIYKSHQDDSVQNCLWRVQP